MNLENMFTDYPDVVGVNQLCEMLQISKTTAYSLLRQGAISSFLQGNTYKIPKPYVFTYINDMVEKGCGYC